MCGKKKQKIQLKNGRNKELIEAYDKRKTRLLEKVVFEYLPRNEEIKCVWVVFPKFLGKKCWNDKNALASWESVCSYMRNVLKKMDILRNAWNNKKKANVGAEKLRVQV